MHVFKLHPKMPDHSSMHPRKLRLSTSDDMDMLNVTVVIMVSDMAQLKRVYRFSSVNLS